MVKQIRKIVASYKDQKSALMNILSDIQKYYGFLSEELLRELSKETKIPLAKIYSAVSFYSFLFLEKKRKYIIRVCNSPSCYVNGSENIIKEIKKVIKKNKKFSLEKASCIGCCNKAPAMRINDKIYTSLTKEKIKTILKRLK